MLFEASVLLDNTSLMEERVVASGNGDTSGCTNEFMAKKRIEFAF